MEPITFDQKDVFFAEVKFQYAKLQNPLGVPSVLQTRVTTRRRRRNTLPVTRPYGYKEQLKTIENSQ